jgi:PAS domain S-box-containing protein
MTDSDHRCTYVSGYWREFTGRDPEKDLGFGWIEALHPDDREQVVDGLIEASRTLTACQGEYRVTRANGDLGWLYYYGVPHLHTDGTYAGHIGTCIDITHHKANEKAGLQLQNSLVLGQEAERKRVASELHDDIVQKLALVGLQLREAQQSCMEESPSLGAKLNTVRQQVQSIALDIHRISHNLHPAALVHLGLVSALRSLCREFSARTRIAIGFTSDVESIDASGEVGIALYRVTQESLSNVARHSRSAHANVTLRKRAGLLRLTITDAGIGFEPEQLPSAGGLGLISIRERARMIGANLEIASAPLCGTKVELCVPIAALSGAGQTIDEMPPSGV